MEMEIENNGRRTRMIIEKYNGVQQENVWRYNRDKNKDE
jgi:hypothetical protein